MCYVVCVCGVCVCMCVCVHHGWSVTVITARWRRRDNDTRYDVDGGSKGGHERLCDYDFIIIPPHLTPVPLI